MKRKNNVIVILSVVLVLAILAGSLSVLTAGFANWDYNSWFDRFKPSPAEVIDESVTESVLEASASVGDIKFKYSGGETSITKRITASLSPSTATPEDIIWTVAWETGNTFGDDKDISNYVTLVASGANNYILDVTCLLAFEGNVVLTATTEVTNVSGTCTVRFVGLPSSFNVTVNDVVNTITTAPFISTHPCYVLPFGTHTISKNFINSLGPVGAAYKDVTVTCEIYGGDGISVSIDGVVYEDIDPTAHQGFADLTLIFTETENSLSFSLTEIIGSHSLFTKVNFNEPLALTEDGVYVLLEQPSYVVTITSEYDSSFTKKFYIKGSSVPENVEFDDIDF